MDNYEWHSLKLLKWLCFISYVKRWKMVGSTWIEFSLDLVNSQQQIIWIYVIEFYVTENI